MGVTRAHFEAALDEMALSAPWSSDRALRRPFGLSSAEQAAELTGAITGVAQADG